MKTIHVINLDTQNNVDPYAAPHIVEEIKRSRELRALSIVKQSKQHGFAVRFWEGDTSDKVFMSKNVMRAFKKIVMYAKEENLPYVTIGEDDLRFTSPGAWQHYVDQWPKKFDLYSGGIYAGQVKDGRIINGYSGNTLMTVHENFYDFFLSADENKHLDRYLGEYCQEKLYMVVEPFVVKQSSGTYSDNKRRVMDYSMYECSWQYFGIPV